MSTRSLRVIERLVSDHQLVFEFFAVFSRFEYALKRSGFVKRGPHDEAQPDWFEFAQGLTGRFAVLQAKALKDAIAYLLRNPPKTQVVARGAKELHWKETTRDAPASEEEYVLRLVRTVRNNLFHGGKYPYPDGPVEDAGRNRQLLRSSLCILDCCLQLSPVVQGNFAEMA